MYFPKDIYSLRLVYEYIINNSIDFYIIGNGTNLVINNRYFNKVFINLKELNKIYYLDDNKILILSGVRSMKAAYMLGKRGYTKQEFLSVIPGSIGGSIYMNAGAFNNSIDNIIENVLILDSCSKLKLLKKEECDFSYRKSIFMKDSKVIILGGIFKLLKAQRKDTPLKLIKEYVSSKRKIQPLHLRSAGSTFKNPKEICAWELVDKLGYRGSELGGAKVSQMHSNFLINNNHATFNDIYNLMFEITLKAKETYNIDLECEWQILK